MKVGLLSRLSLHTMLDRFPGNYDVEKFLEIFSEEDYDAFCLAYMFTYRCTPSPIYRCKTVVESGKFGFGLKSMYFNHWSQC